MFTLSSLARFARLLRTDGHPASAGGGNAPLPPGLEPFEPRLVLAAVSWTGAAGDSLWHTPGNWSSNAVPTVADDVTIDVPAAPTINFTSTTGDRSVRSLLLRETLSLSGGTLRVADAATIEPGAVARLQGGTLRGGAWTTSAADSFQFTTTGGTLVDLAISGDIVLDGSDEQVTIAGSTTFAAARLTGYNVYLRLAPGYTLTSAIIAGGSVTGFRAVTLSHGGPGTITFAPSAQVRLMSGANAGLSLGAGAGVTLINQGLISAEAAGRSLSIQQCTLRHTGTLQAQAGTLTVNPAGVFVNAGAFNVASAATVNMNGSWDATLGIGTWTNAGGTVNIQGAISNSGNTIALGASIGSWTLLGGAINGGAVTYSDGRRLNFSSAGGTLDNVNVGGELVLDSTDEAVAVSGSTSFTAARLAAGDVELRMAPGFTLETSVFGEGPAGGTRTIVIAYGGQGTVTFEPSAQVRLLSGCGGSLSISNRTNATLINRGLISAEATGVGIGINNFTLTHSGVMRAVAGSFSVNPTNPYINEGTFAVDPGATFSLNGTYHTVNGIGAWENTGGSVIVRGTISNYNGVIPLSAATGSWTLSGATINNGLITYSDGRRLEVTSTGATLNNVTVAGEISLDSTGEFLKIWGQTSLAGVRLAAAGAELRVVAGTVVNFPILAEGAGFSARVIRLAYGAAGTVTFGPAAQVRLLSGAGGNLQIFNDQQATLINRGLISSEAQGRTLSVHTTLGTQTGTIQALAGTLTLNPIGSYVNAGTFGAAPGGVLELDGALDTTGGIGAWANTGVVRILGDIANTGNTIALNAATGSWTMYGGSITGGSITYADGQRLLFTSTGLLTDVALEADILLDSFNQGITIGGATTFTAARLSADSVDLRFAPGAVLSSPVYAEGPAGGLRTIVLASSAAGSVTFAPTAQVRLMAHCGGGLSIVNGSAATLVNQGLISSEATDRALTIQCSSLTNTGTMRAVGSGTLTISPVNPYTNAGALLAMPGGTIALAGTFDATAGIGTIVNTGGVVSVQGTINNTGSTLELNAATGPWTMSGGSISGGSLTYADTSTLVFSSAGGTLNNVAVAGDLVFDSPGQAIALAGATTFATARLRAPGADLRLVAGYTLASPVLADGPAGDTRRVTLAWGGAGAVTFAPTAQVRLLPGSIGDLQIVNTSASVLVNQGLISAESGVGSLWIVNATFTNNGTLQALAGTLHISPQALTNWISGNLVGGSWIVGAGASFVSTAGGPITTNSATVVLEGAWPAMNPLAGNDGALSLGAGFDLTLPASLTNRGTLTLEPGSTLTLPGSFTQAASGVLSIEASGTSPLTGYGRIVAAADATLAGTVNFTLVAGYQPQYYDSFQFISAASVSGVFSLANLPGPIEDATNLLIYTPTSATLYVSPLADFNVDGQVDFFDYLDFAQAFSNEDSLADFDGNGQIDFFDYLDFVNAFSRFN
jgi:hypothetical protein